MLLAELSSLPRSFGEILLSLHVFLALVIISVGCGWFVGELQRERI